MGLPGSGKTTLAAHVQEALVARGMPCSVADRPISAAVPTPLRAARRVRGAGLELVRHPRRSLSALRLLPAAGQASARDRLAGAVQWLAVQRLVRRGRRRPGVHLLEEGPLQTRWTLALRSVRTGEPVPAAERPPDLLVVVQAPLEALSARLGARPSVHSRTQRLDPRARLVELRRGQVLLEELVATSRAPRVVVVNDGSVPPHELGRWVAEWVLRAAPGCRGSTEWQPGARPGSGGGTGSSAGVSTR